MHFAIYNAFFLSKVGLKRRQISTYDEGQYRWSTTLKLLQIDSLGKGISSSMLKLDLQFLRYPNEHSIYRLIIWGHNVLLQNLCRKFR